MLNINFWTNNIESRPDLGERYRKNFRDLLAEAGKMEEFRPDKPVILVRCPGRYREYGSHTDYIACGGPVCSTASEEAIYCLFQARDDSQVKLYNTDPTFTTRHLDTDNFNTGLGLHNDWETWNKWTTQHYYQHKDSSLFAPESWDKYIRGLLYLLSELPCEAARTSGGDLPGFTALFSSDLSYNGGKSSSSALVVSTALALDALFKFEKPKLDDWIDLIGMSEWYVMTRGGCADHAAMFYSREGCFTLAGSFPTSRMDETLIPGELARVILHCGRDRLQDEVTLNEMRVGGAGYILAMLYIKQNHPELRDELESNDSFYHIGNLREFTSIGRMENRIPLKTIYNDILRGIPVSAGRKTILDNLPDFNEDVLAVFANHREPEHGYPLRNIAVFGLSEIERSIAFMTACRNENIGKIIRLFRMTQDGDRMKKYHFRRNKWVPEDFNSSLSDQRLDELVQVLEHNPDSLVTRLLNHPGGFNRSMPQMDLIADIIQKYFPTEAGICVMGAGKGGEMHAVVVKEHLDSFIKVLKSEYYNKIADIREPRIQVLEDAAEGARVLEP
jgi:galactokinase